MSIYLIGDSCVIGNMVCKPSQLTEYTEINFFKMLENSLKKHNFEHHRKDAFKKSNLKKGITIGRDYFIIETKR